MRKKVGKVGNSAMVVIDRDSRAISGIGYGDVVEMSASSNKIVIRKCEIKSKKGE